VLDCDTSISGACEVGCGAEGLVEVEPVSDPDWSILLPAGNLARRFGSSAHLCLYQEYQRCGKYMYHML
jgi:hypothetical protein